MNEKDQSKVVHDINSAISSISQAIEIFADNWKENEDLVEKLLPLTQEKMAELKEDWKYLKENNLK